MWIVAAPIVIAALVLFILLAIFWDFADDPSMIGGIVIFIIILICVFGAEWTPRSRKRYKGWSKDKQ